MKSKITFLLLALFMFVSNTYSQFDAQHPDLRLCGSPPNYYLDAFNCTSNNFTLNDVFLSLTNVDGTPLNNTTCTIGSTQQVYVMLNYTSNASNTPNNGRLFADLSIDGNIVQINSYIGSIAPGAGQRQIYGPFVWTCGQELILSRILVVWRTGGSAAQLPSYDCSTYGSAQCELPSITVVSKPLAVQFTYKACRNGNNTTVNFTSTTNGGIAPYTFAWDFNGDGVTDSTIANPTYTYQGTGSATLTVTDSQGLVNTYTLPIVIPTEMTLSANPTHVGCGGAGTGAIDLSVSGGTPAYTYSWSNGQTTQDLANLTPGTYTVTVTDSNGCQKTLPVIINGGDSTNPVVTAPANITMEGCNSASIGTAGYPAFSTAQTTVSATVFAGLGGVITDASTIASITYQDVQTGTCPKTITRTWRVTDACGNVGTAVQTIIIQDTTAPVFEPLVASYEIFCPATPVFDAAKAIDACDNFPVLTYVDVTTAGACAGAYTIVRTWTATDACGNFSTAVQTVMVKDNTAPVIAPLPGVTTINCPATPQFAQATAVDACGSGVTLTSSDHTTTTCAGTYTVVRTWTAVDGCGNASTATQTINVVDNVGPVFAAMPGITTISCPATPAFTQATATDACSPTVDITSNDVTTPGSCAGTYSVTRTWTATDACGNVTTATQTIHVQDNAGPVISVLPAPTTITCSETPQFAVATAVDACGSTFTLTSSDSTAPGTCAGAYSVTRTWTATDACGNVSTASQTINVQDTEAPVISALPSPTTISCPATPQFATATAVDACGGTFTLDFTDSTTAGACAGSYSVTRTWTAVDACGNTSSATQTITVVDTTAPVISQLPAVSTISCPAAPQFATPTATDACGSAVTLDFDDVTTQGACTGSYSVTRTWTATDACGNASTATQTINVQDNTAPVITTQASNATAECNGQGNQDALTAWLASNGGAAANDACSTVTWSNNFTSLSNDCAAAVTVIFTATDACGNTATTSATFTVNDTTPPAAPTAPANVTVACASLVPATISLTATDGCSGTITAQGVDAVTPGACANSFTIVRTWTFTDACGNTSSVSQTITVNDNIPPVAPEAPATVNVACASAVPANMALTANDNCNGAITVEGVSTLR